MQSKAHTVDKFMQELPPDRAEALKKMRAICQERLTGYTETMRYGMPSYERSGIVEVAFNSQKNYIALYILKKDALDTSRHELRGLSVGKSCIRYTKPEKINFSTIEKMLSATKESTGPVC